MKYVLLAGMVLINVLVATCEAVTRYVSLDGHHQDPYTNWYMAATNLNNAISADGDMIIVSNGLYRLSNASKVDIWKCVTITSLYGAAQTVFDGGGGANYGFRIGYNYITSRVYGITITNFFGLGFYKAGAGGEITFDSCIVAGNSNSGAGGGFYIGSGSLSLTNCLVNGNTSGDMGGGIDLWTGGTGTCRVDNTVIINNRSLARYGSGISAAQLITVRNCTIANNTGAGTTPAGIYLETAGSRVTDSLVVSNTGGCGVYMTAGTFINNSTVTWHSNANGGGIYNLGGTIFNCFVANNSANSSGGGIFSGSGAISNCKVVSNYAKNGGGGIAGGSSIIRNCLVKHNRASGLDSSGQGGGISGAGIIANCTIVSNVSDWASGGVFRAHCLNSIIFFNISGANSNYWLADTVRMPWTNCLTAPDPATLTIGGTNCITSNPKMVNMPTDCRLLKGSPCINAGTNQAWMNTDVDLDGRARIRDGTVDIGAYEWFPNGAVVIFR